MRTAFNFCGRVLALFFVLACAPAFSSGSAPQECPLSAPQPINPAGAGQGIRPSFSWTAVTGAENYYMYIVAVADAYLGTGPAQLLGPFTTNSFTPDSDLPGPDYAWLVFAQSQQCGFSGYSAVAFFTTVGTCPTPMAEGPLPDIASGGVVQFSWSLVPSASIYAITVSNDATGMQAFQTFWGTNQRAGQFGWVIRGAQATLAPGSYTGVVYTFNSVCGATASRPVSFVVP